MIRLVTCSLLIQPLTMTSGRKESFKSSLLTPIDLEIVPSHSFKGHSTGRLQSDYTPDMVVKVVRI